LVALTKGRPPAGGAEPPIPGATSRGFRGEVLADGSAERSHSPRGSDRLALARQAVCTSTPLQPSGGR